MCARYNLRVTAAELIEFFNIVRELSQFPPRYNINPTDLVIYLVDGDAGREARIGPWGFTASWDKGLPVFNARAEEVFDKRMWKNVIRRQRCLVPASSYYEFTDTGQRRKQRWHIFPRNGEPLGLAGVFNDKGEVSILTNAPNAEQAVIHDRQPVFLSRDVWGRYLDSSITDPEEIRPMIGTPPDGTVSIQAVIESQKGWAADDPRWIEPLKTVPTQRSLFGGDEAIA